MLQENNSSKHSLAEIAVSVGLPLNTVRSHFNSYSDVFKPERDVGPRGKRRFGSKTVDAYRLFLVLKGDEVRLSSSEAILLLRGGYFDTLEKAYKSSINELLIAVQRTRAAVNTSDDGET